MKTVLAVVTIAGIALCIGSEAVAGGQATTAVNNRYLLVHTHTKDNCLSSLDDMARDPALLAKFDWGCKVGHHKGYAIVEAPDEKAAIELLPPSQRGSAQATLMTKYTPEKLQEIHQRTGR